LTIPQGLPSRQKATRRSRSVLKTFALSCPVIHNTFKGLISIEGNRAWVAAWESAREITASEQQSSAQVE
jgi:hypothetical protein